MAPIYTNFEGGARAEKTGFFGQNFPKKPKNVYFLPVFSKFCLRRRKSGRNSVFLVLWQSSENQFGRPKKKGRQNFRFFLKNPPPPPPPRENPRSAPGWRG